jgi:voltage-gated potassium channel
MQAVSDESPLERDSGSLRVKDLERARQRRLDRALCALLFVVIGGTAGFVFIEDWGIWRSLYFTLITITTVGYGDQGISENGQMFAALLLVGGIGTASYTFAVVMQNAVANQFAWRIRMQKKIDRMRGHVIVCGYGRMGETVCGELAAAKVAFVVVERDPARFQRASDAGYLAVEGSAGEDETLLAAGIKGATCIVATANAEGVNIVIALSARDLAPDITIIARAEGDEEMRKLRRAGVTRTVSPYHSGGIEIAHLIARPGVADFLAQSTLSGGKVALAEVRVQEDSRLVNQTIAAYGASEGSRISFVALEHAGEEVMIPPRGTECFRADDRLIVAGDPEQIATMQEQGGATTQAA